MTKTNETLKLAEDNPHLRSHCVSTALEARSSSFISIRTRLEHEFFSGTVKLMHERRIHTWFFSPGLSCTCNLRAPPSCFQDGFWNFKETSAVQLATEGTEMGVAELRYPVHASSGQKFCILCFFCPQQMISVVAASCWRIDRAEEEAFNSLIIAAAPSGGACLGPCSWISD